MSNIFDQPALPIGKLCSAQDAHLTGVPSPVLTANVLNSVFDGESVQVLTGFQLLVARHLETDVGIFVVNGSFGAEHHLVAVAEAQNAGLTIHEMHVYARSTSCSREGINVTLFEDIWPV